MMLEKLFLTVLEVSIASFPVILLLLLTSPLLRKRYSPKLCCLLWLVLAVRLALPVNMPWSNAFQINLFPVAESQSAEPGWFLPNPAHILEGGAEAEAENSLLEQGNNRRKAVKVTHMTLLAAAWAAGTALFLLYHLGAYFHTLRRLRRWSAAVLDKDTLRGLADVKRELSIHKDVGLYSSSKAASPLLMGFIHPRIILPDEPLTPEQLDFMLRHELWHLRRGDLWYKLLVLSANAVHWFNPLVWLIDRQSGLDTELACDADVLSGYDSGERTAYGYTVLSFLDQGWRCKTPLTSRFFGGKRQMKQRFYNIADDSPKKRGWLLFCAVALVIALAGCTVHAAGAEQSGTAGTETTATADMEARQPQQPQAPAANDQSEADEIFRNIEWSEIELSENSYTGGVMAWPLPDYYTITSGFGPRYGGTDYHTGICISGEGVAGKPIVAANDGTVARVVTEYTAGLGYGMYVILDHGGGVTTLYANCGNIIVKEGDIVKKGQKIAEVGSTGFSTGPHLHFEVREDGKTQDPMPYISSPGFIWPTNGGYISTGLNGYPGHTGIDIARPNGRGTPIYAAADGVVVKAVESNVGYGKHIIIDHGNGYNTLYAMNDKLLVKVGDTVTQGQAIAEMGRSGNATGVHLHFEVRYNGKILDPEDFLIVPTEVQSDSKVFVSVDDPDDPLKYVEVYPTEKNLLKYEEVDPASNPLDYAEYDRTENSTPASPGAEGAPENAYYTPTTP